MFCCLFGESPSSSQSCVTAAQEGGSCVLFSLKSQGLLGPPWAWGSVQGGCAQPGPGPQHPEHQPDDPLLTPLLPLRLAPLGCEGMGVRITCLPLAPLPSPLSPCLSSLPGPRCILPK